MAKNREFFTSESVTEGHPDKMADQISDGILDAILAQDTNARVACETLVTTGLVHVVGEISTSCYVDIPKIIRETVRDIGYTRAKYGFDCDTCGVLVSLDEQSSDIAMGVDEAKEAKDAKAVTKTNSTLSAPVIRGSCSGMLRMKRKNTCRCLFPWPTNCLAN